MNIKEKIVALRRAGVPLVAIETADPAETAVTWREALQGFKEPALTWEKCPALLWDTVRGGRPMNDAGLELGKGWEGVDSQDPASFLAGGTNAQLPDNCIVFVSNAHRYLASNEIVVQAIWNLRDAFKAKGSTVVLMGPIFKLPIELTNDVLVISEPLPTAIEVAKIVDDTVGDAIKLDSKKKVVDALLGVSAFAAEQTLALSCSRGRVDFEELLAQKRKMVQQTDGLSLAKPDPGAFDRLGGLASAKAYLRNIIGSKHRPIRCVGFLDEIEKLLAGTAGDLSGVSQDQLRVLLTEMQDNEIPGIILIGPSGTGKTALSRATASVSGAEFIQMDTGAMTGSLVGESQAKIRAAFKTFNAVSQGRGMIVATCNKITALPPELRRRVA